MANSKSLSKTTLVKPEDQQENAICQDKCHLMSSVSSSGTFVNGEETPKEHIIPLSYLSFLTQLAKLKLNRTIHAIPFLDILVTRNQNNTVMTSIYRKKTFTGLSLHNMGLLLRAEDTADVQQ